MNGTPEQQAGPAEYPIQVTFITVREVHFISHRPPSPNDKIEESTISIRQAATPFNEATRRVQVTLNAEFGRSPEPQPNPPPFSVKVAMTGEFVIHPSFPSDKINLWVTQNSTFVIYPYLRERLYYLTSQAGYPPILLPLLQIPTIKVEAQRAPHSDATSRA
jgi:preprotein translocase subunit SecB